MSNGTNSQGSLKNVKAAPPLVNLKTSKVEYGLSLKNGRYDQV